MESVNGKALLDDKEDVEVESGTVGIRLVEVEMGSGSERTFDESFVVGVEGIRSTCSMIRLVGDEDVYCKRKERD